MGHKDREKSSSLENHVLSLRDLVTLLLLGAVLPECDDRVGTTGHDRPSISTCRKSPDLVLVIVHRGRTLLVSDVPQLHQTISST